MYAQQRWVLETLLVPGGQVDEALDLGPVLTRELNIHHVRQSQTGQQFVVLVRELHGSVLVDCEDLVGSVEVADQRDHLPVVSHHEVAHGEAATHHSLDAAVPGVHSHQMILRAVLQSRIDPASVGGKLRAPEVPVELSRQEPRLATARRYDCQMTRRVPDDLRFGDGGVGDPFTIGTPRW